MTLSSASFEGREETTIYKASDLDRRDDWLAKLNEAEIVLWQLAGFGFGFWPHLISLTKTVLPSYLIRRIRW
jgi:hypothetical protein